MNRIRDFETPNLLFRQTGFALLELIVGAGLLGLIGLAVATMASSQSRVATTASGQAFRNDFSAALKAVVSSQAAIIYTMTQPENVALHDCIVGNPGAGSGACVAGITQPVSLYDVPLPGAATPAPALSGPAGPTGAPRYYDAHGLSCQLTSNHCVFRGNVIIHCNLCDWNQLCNCPIDRVRLSD